ncbi:hypothetical protein AKJ45_03630 [candidate division MSBL1 archaeon SCGC-AAA261F19]|uniref:DUF4258 domain-containing protein n=1 Tax=candidate division MSBL1 archaeon SCGC-AAA261F19 TaxID=1698275 RepID=A0A133V767_9EURY|nr:hypothetical protein AKJ45_03630 [candidate division MSBL1 archaeon SCGC-AAA261F19]
MRVRSFLVIRPLCRAVGIKTPETPISFSSRIFSIFLFLISPDHHRDLILRAVYEEAEERITIVAVYPGKRRRYG